jgi:hypothetical protein
MAWRIASGNMGHKATIPAKSGSHAEESDEFTPDSAALEGVDCRKLLPGLLVADNGSSPTREPNGKHRKPSRAMKRGCQLALDLALQRLATVTWRPRRQRRKRNVQRICSFSDTRPCPGVSAQTCTWQSMIMQPPRLIEQGLRLWVKRLMGWGALPCCQELRSNCGAEQALRNQANEDGASARQVKRALFHCAWLAIWKHSCRFKADPRASLSA